MHGQGSSKLCQGLETVASIGVSASLKFKSEVASNMNKTHWTLVNPFTMPTLSGFNVSACPPMIHMSPNKTPCRSLVYLGQKLEFLNLNCSGILRLIPRSFSPQFRGFPAGWSRGRDESRGSQSAGRRGPLTGVRRKTENHHFQLRTCRENTKNTPHQKTYPPVN